MLLNCEKDIDIDYNTAIDTFVVISDLLNDNLILKWYYKNLFINISIYDNINLCYMCIYFLIF